MTEHGERSPDPVGNFRPGNSFPMRHRSRAAASAMTSKELAARLRETYFAARDTETCTTVAVCVFGVRHSRVLLQCGVPVRKLCRMAGIPNLSPTLNLGTNLARYVSIVKLP